MQLLSIYRLRSKVTYSKSSCYNKVNPKWPYLFLQYGRWQACRVGVSGDMLATSSDVAVPGGLRNNDTVSFVSTELDDDDDRRQ